MTPDRRASMLRATILLWAGLCLFASSGPLLAGELELTAQSRDASSGEPISRVMKLDPRKTAVVLVDTWNYHWCLTATERCGSFAARFNQALPELRQLGMHIFWCPTDVADQYVGTAMREQALALPRRALPPSRNIPFSPIECFESNKCMCGPGLKCVYNYGWDGLAPALHPADGDLMPEGTQELYSACQKRGVTHLIYFGFHTNVCTTGKPVGIRAMANAGLTCLLARDMTDAISGYDPASGHHPDTNTQEVIATIERQVPTVHIADELRKLGKWTDKPVDPVRITPGGTVNRPYLFEDATLVSLSSPLTPGVKIFYTLDGTEPTSASPTYTKPFKISQTTVIRAIGLDESGKTVCLPAAGQCVKLPPLPPKPSVYLSGIKPRHASSSGFHHFGSNKLPRMDKAYSGEPLRFRGQEFARGVGVAAPAQLLYDVRPEYERFVGRVAVDETIQADDMARAVGMYPSVIAEVWIDGSRVSQSPMLRYQAEPWRFDVPIPKGSRTISLVVTDGGNGNREDFANWLDAGFVQDE